jgi:hypothetical protein
MPRGGYRHRFYHFGSSPSSKEFLAQPDDEFQALDQHHQG